MFVCSTVCLNSEHIIIWRTTFKYVRAVAKINDSHTYHGNSRSGYPARVMCTVDKTLNPPEQIIKNAVLLYNIIEKVRHRVI